MFLTLPSLVTDRFTLKVYFVYNLLMKYNPSHNWDQVYRHSIGIDTPVLAVAYTNGFATRAPVVINLHLYGKASMVENECKSPCSAFTALVAA